MYETFLMGSISSRTLSTTILTNDIKLIHVCIFMNLHTKKTPAIRAIALATLY